MHYGNYPDLSCVRRILVIKMRHHGDVLLTTPLFSKLHALLPHAAIDACIYKDTLPMLEGHPGIADFVLYDKQWKKLPLFKRILKEVALLKRVRSGKYDLVINLTEGDRGAILAKVSGSLLRVGFDPGKSGFFGKRKTWTHVVKNCPHPRHTVERQLDALRRIGIFPEAEEKDLFLHIPDSALCNVRNRLEQEEIRPGSYILIHPVSRWKFKCLSIQQMVQLIVALDKRGMRIVLSAGPDLEECAMVDKILSLLPSAVSVVNLAGKLTLKELAALITMSRALICVDSVPLHIASATKTPVVALFGPTSDQNWGPWMHRRSKVVSHPFSCRPCYQDGCGGSKVSDCLLAISQGAILSALDEVLGERSQLLDHVF